MKNVDMKKGHGGWLSKGGGLKARSLSTFFWGLHQEKEGVTEVK